MFGSSRRLVVGMGRTSVVLVLALSGQFGPALAAGAAHASAPGAGAEPDPLRVTLHSLAPSALVPGQPVDVSGTVANRTGDTWQELKVYLVNSATPMTSRAELAAAVESDPDEYIGSRIIELGWFAALGDLAPGATRDFALHIPYRLLDISGEPGAYWLAVHVLATSPDGIRDSVADAQIRTFIPLLPDKPAPTPVRLGLIWPLVAPVPQLRAGVFANDRLGASMAAGGRLSALLGMAADAPRGLSLLVDPAVLAAAGQMSGGYRIAVDGRPRGPSAAAAEDWLADFVAQAQDGSVLSLPYGDPDVASLSHARLGSVLTPAVSAAQTVLRRTGVDATVAAWPVHGLADRPTLAAAHRAGAVLAVLSDRSLPPTPTGSPDPALAIRAAAEPVPVVVTDSATSGGGPRPGWTDSPLQIRQRILAETAVASLTSTGGQPATVVAALPRGWDPGDRWEEARFFQGLDVPWLSIRPVTALVAGKVPDFVGRLRYPSRLTGAELPDVVLDGVRALRRLSGTLTGLLTDSRRELAVLEPALGLAASAAWRANPVTGVTLAAGHIAGIRRELQGVDVQASRFVTLSSRSGRFPVTIANNLDQRVRVGLVVIPANPALKIDPIRPITIQANQRSTVTVTAHAQRVGLTNVSVRAVTPDNRAFGPQQVVDVRATQYGVVGWMVIGVGTSVLAAAAALRIARRLLDRHRRVAGAATR